MSGYPTAYARDSVPVLRGYPDGQTLPTPSAIDFTPGELLGCVSGELGLHRFREAEGHTLLVTSGSTLSAQARYAAGTREILEAFLGGTPVREENLIVQGGALAGTGAKSYTAGGDSSPGSSGR